MARPKAQKNFPKLHNATWPGVVGKGSPDNPVIELRQMLELTKNAEYEGVHFDGVDRTVDGFDGLQAAQESINSNEKRDAFAKDYRRLSNIWESLSPDPALEPYRVDYKWLSNVYQSVKPSGPDALGKLIWLSLGAQTKKIMYENIHVSGIHTDMEEVILDETMVSALMGNKDMKAAKKMERELIKRFKKHADKPKFVKPCKPRNKKPKWKSAKPARKP